MNLDKSFKLINHLLTFGEVDTKTIMEAFSDKKITLRTAQRYMSTLRSLPDVVDNGNGKVSLAGRSPYQKIVDNVALSTARANINNLQNVFGERQSVGDIKKRLGANGEKIFVRSDNFINYDPIEPIVNGFMNYIQDTVIEITYASDKIHTVQPYLILIEKGFWYLACYSEDYERMQYLRLDRIKSFKPTSPTRFFNVDQAELDKIKKAKSVFAGEEAEVIIHIAANVAHYFKSRDILADQNILSEDENGLTISMTTTNDCDFLLQILPCVNFIRVETEYYRDVLTDCLQEALENNKQ
jgi:predicted DNA-binding transcriptional regulator YafY